MDVKGFLKEMTSGRDYLGQISGEHIIPPVRPVMGIWPRRYGDAGRRFKRSDRRLYSHSYCG